MTEFRLRYTGGLASKSQLDFYDASQALLGFQRSLALTMHLVANGEIITQSPSLKNAQTLVRPPQEGSWEIIVGAVFTAAGGAAVAPKDTVLGHFTRSMYDYLLKAVLGIDVDFDKTIRQQYGEICESKKITESKTDSLIEKCESAIVSMHRPIIWSETARQARVTFGESRDARVGPALNQETYEHATRTVKLKSAEWFEGFVSSYNSNTYKGRLFVPELQRPIPFELSEDNRRKAAVRSITESLAINAIDRSHDSGQIAVQGFRRESSTGRLKSLWVTKVAPAGTSLL